MNSNLKKIFMPALAMMISVAAFSQSKTTAAPVERKEINIIEEYDEVEVKGDVTVILTRGAAGEIMMEGTAEDICCIKTKVKKGKLVIDAGNRKFSSKLSIFVSMVNVNSLIINKGTEIFSFSKFPGYSKIALQ